MKRTIHILSYILAVILLCGITASCSKEDNDTPATKTAEETILMFFPSSGLEASIQENINCMKQAIVTRGGLSNKRMVVCQALYTGGYKFYEIKYKDGACTDVSIQDKLSFVFSSYNQEEVVSQLQQILQLTKTNAPASTYSMIIGCHGSGWLPAGQTIESMLSGTAVSKAYGTANAAEQIDNASLATALKNEGMHLNFLLFDACYMGTVETAYEYRDVCDYYLSSPNEIMQYGVPYDYIGDALLRHDYQSVVESYVYFYRLNADPWGTFSAVDCTKLGLLATLMKELNTSYIPEDADISDVQVMDGFSPRAPTVFFDLKDYVDKCCTDQAKAAEFDTLVRQVIPYARHTDAFFCYFHYPEYIDISAFCGLSTSQPTRNSKALQNIATTAWWKATH